MRLATVATALRQLPAFRNVSLRLLEDLVELAATDTLDPGDPLFRETLFVMALEGRLVVEPPDGAVGPQRLSHRHQLGPGEICHSHGAPVHLRAARGERARAMTLATDELGRLLDASPTLARSLHLSLGDDGRVLPGLETAATSPEFILLTEEPGLDAPVEMLAYLLAAALERDLHETAGVVAVGPTGQGPLRMFTHPRCGPSCHTDRYSHMILALPATKRIPAPGPPGHFHRIVYLCSSAPSDSTAPFQLFPLLKPALFDPRTRRGPYFSSFVATVLLGPTPTGTRWPFPSPAPLLPFGGLRTIRTEPVADVTAPIAPVTVAERLERDLCRIRLDSTALRAEGNAASTIRAFVASAFVDPSMHETVMRWARAVTNRQVGVALSGGGATQAELIPFLDNLLAAGVPVDVVTGVSGGAVLGAYLCTGGRLGLNTYLHRGLLFQAGLSLSMLHSGVIESVFDHEFTGITLDELEARFVPVSSVLTNGERLEGHAVVGGTLGEAVRASSAAPVVFGPAQREGRRYLDGGSTLPIPAAVLAGYGADLVFAFNSIGRPRVRNFLGSFLPGIGEVLYRYTPFGRLIDFTTSFFLLLDSASADAADSADEFYAVPSEDIPLIEGFFWIAAERIAKKAAGRTGWREAAARCVRRWREFAGLESYT